MKDSALGSINFYHFYFDLVLLSQLGHRARPPLGAGRQGNEDHAMTVKTCNAQGGI